MTGLVLELAADGIPVAMTCRVLQLPRSTFYDAKTRPSSAREVADGHVSELVTEVHQMSRGFYGSPRVHAELRLGLRLAVARKRVTRLMRQAGICGIGGVSKTRRRVPRAVHPLCALPPLDDRSAQDSWPIAHALTGCHAPAQDPVLAAGLGASARGAELDPVQPRRTRAMITRRSWGARRCRCTTAGPGRRRRTGAAPGRWSISGGRLKRIGYLPVGRSLLLVDVLVPVVR